MFAGNKQNVIFLPFRLAFRKKNHLRYYSYMYMKITRPHCIAYQNNLLIPFQIHVYTQQVIQRDRNENDIFSNPKTFSIYKFVKFHFFIYTIMSLDEII